MPPRALGMAGAVSGQDVGQALPITNILYVDLEDPKADFDTIQAALNDAINGTLILVGIGDYPEELSIPAGINLIIEGMGSPLLGLSATGNPQVRINPAMTSAGAAAFSNAGTSAQRVTLRNLMIVPSWNSTSGTGYGIFWDVTSTDQLTLIDCIVQPICIGTGSQGPLVAIRAEGNGKVHAYNGRSQVNDALSQLPANINTIECDGGSSEIHLFDYEVTENNAADPPAQIQASTEGEIFLRNVVCKGNLKSLNVLDKFYFETSVQFKGFDSSFLGRIIDKVYRPTAWRPVRAATTATVTLAGGAPDTVDGVALAVNDRILVKNQSTASQNGIYYVSTLGTGSNGTWTREGDAEDDSQFLGGKLVAVSEGTANGNELWQLTTNDPITVGTTSLSFLQKDAGGGGQTDTIVGSSGITNVGDNVDADLAPTYGTAVNTICQGNDARLSDKRTASALGTTGADVNADAAAPPTTGQVLTATGATAATWQTPSGGGGVFGTEYHSAESLGQSTTTTQDPTWTQKLKLTTGVLPIGTYIVHWSAGGRVDGASGAKACDIQLEMDDTTSLGKGVARMKDDETNQYVAQSGFAEVTFGTAAVHDFDIDFRVATGNSGEVQIIDARISLWRIS